MTYAVPIARVLLGAIFLLSGIAGFVLIGRPLPEQPGLAGAFQSVYFASRWVLFVDALQAVAAVLLLANLYVPLALTVLAGIITNIFIFHVTMAPSGLPIVLVLVVLWTTVALHYRSAFAPLLARRRP